MSIYDNKTELLRFLNIEENFLYGDFSKHFRLLKIPKKRGGTRDIYPPDKKLKDVQENILKDILKKADYLPCVYGLSKETDIVANAKKHQINHSGFLLNLDIKDFFPSVPMKEVNFAFARLGFGKENAKILTKLCTYNKSIPQGAPTSSHLSCLCFNKLDRKIYKFCRKKNLIYTRYIDDISISGGQISPADRVAIKNIIIAGGYRLNDKEILLQSDDEKIINGIKFSKSEITVLDNYKIQIYSLLQEYNQTRNPITKLRYVGKLGFFYFINKSKALLFQKEIENTLTTF